MYFLQKDDIMLHFTLTGSSDITGCQCLLFCTVKYDEISFSNLVAFSEYLNFNTVKRSGLVRPNSVYIIPSTVLTSGCSSTYLFFLMTGHYTLIKSPTSF